MDYVLFSDSTVKPATNAQQWYVTISRGRRGIRIFTPDKQQLRENVTRSGHRPLAMEFAANFVPRGRHLPWNRLHGYAPRHRPLRTQVQPARRPDVRPARPRRSRVAPSSAARTRFSTISSASNPLWTLDPTSTKNTHASCTRTKDVVKVTAL